MKENNLHLLHFSVPKSCEDIFLGILSNIENVRLENIVVKTSRSPVISFELYEKSLKKAQELQTVLAKRFQELHHDDIIPKIPQVSVRSILDKDWKESWKETFTLTRISPRCVIRPDFIPYTPDPGEVEIIIDPGMAFGTGAHATTRYCLKTIETLRSSSQQFLDAGCGSGILAIGAVKFGYEKVIAFDNDPEAIKTAQENAIINGVANSIEFYCSPIQEFSPKCTFSVIAANITSNILKKYKTHLVSLLETPGYLVLAGITINQAQSVIDAYSALGLRLINKEAGDEWVGLTFSSPPS